MQPVTFEADGRIGRVTLNRPQVMNAIDDRMPEALAQAVRAANADPKVHVIVLSGAGEAFCAGYDMDFYAQSASGAPLLATEFQLPPSVPALVLMSLGVMIDSGILLLYPGVGSSDRTRLAVINSAIMTGVIVLFIVVLLVGA